MKLGILCLIEEVNNSPKCSPLVRFPKDDSILPKLKKSLSILKEGKSSATQAPGNNRSINQLEKRIQKLGEDGAAMACLTPLIGKIFSASKRDHWGPILKRRESPADEELFTFLVQCKLGSSELLDGSRTARDFLKWAKEKRYPLILFPNGLVLNLANLIWLPNNRRRGTNVDPQDRPPPLLLHWCIGNFLREREEHFARKKVTASDFCNEDALGELNKKLPAAITEDEITKTWINLINILNRKKIQVPPGNPFRIAFPPKPPGDGVQAPRTAAGRPRSRGNGST